MAPDMSPTDRTDRAVLGGHDRLARFAELLALTGLTVALPILDSFSGAPETFVYRRASTFDVLAFALVFTLVLPSLLWAVEQLVGLAWLPLRRGVHLGFVVALFGLAGWQVVERHTDAGVALHIAGVVVLAAAGGAAVFWLGPARTVLRLLALSPLLVATLWVGAGPIHDVAFASGPGTTNGAPVDNPVPIVMVVLDELPTASLLDDEGRVDETLFPGFARLAGDATWYRNTSAVSPTTPEAVPAILTGQYPTDLDKPPVASTHPDNLFSALEGTYDLNVWELVTQLCPPDQCPAEGGAVDQGLPALMADAAQLWTDYVDTPPATEDEAFAIRQSDPEAPAKYERFISSLEDVDGPRLDFVHLALPHQPWRHLPSGARTDAPFLAEGLGAPNYSWQTPFMAEAGRQRHLLQLQRADVLLGQMLQRLDDLDRYDESLVIVTADHGVAFDAGEPIRGLSDGNAEQVMWVPLFVKEPGQASGSVDDRPVETVDVFPTIADVLDMEVSWPVDGTSVAEERTAADEIRRFYPWKLNEVESEDGLPYAEIDGRDGFAQLFEVETAGGAPRDDLQVHRFGRWGSLVGQETATFEVGEPSILEAEVQDKDGDAVDPSHFLVDLGQAVLPVYVRGEITEPGAPGAITSADIVVSVNGFVGGWGETFRKKGTTQFFSLVPQQLFADGDNTVELYEVTGEPGSPVLRPLPINWAG
jgi:hypothetical protein